MKLKKILGNILLGMGCVVLLIGGVAWYLPTVPNRQMQLIVASFRTPSSNWLIQQMNNGMNFAMEHGFLMLLIGLAMIAVGMLLSISARADEQTKTPVSARTGKAAAMTAAPAAPVGPAATIRAAQPVENNPFARYMKDDSLPKSTPTPAGIPVSDTVVQDPAEPDDAQDSRDDILNIWDKIQEQPEDSDNLFIQPVRVEDDEAYRRPEESDDEAIPINQPELPDDTLSAPAIDEAPISAAMPEPVPVKKPESLLSVEPVTAPDPEPVPPSPTLDRPRPIIRSTFRKSTADQPAQEPAAEIPVEMPAAPAEPPMETLSENAVEAPAPQPASRIKSTMGRKR